LLWVRGRCDSALYLCILRTAAWLSSHFLKMRMERSWRAVEIHRYTGIVIHSVPVKFAFLFLFLFLPLPSQTISYLLIAIDVAHKHKLPLLRLSCIYCNCLNCIFMRRQSKLQRIRPWRTAARNLSSPANVSFSPT